MPLGSGGSAAGVEGAALDVLESPEDEALRGREQARKGTCLVEGRAPRRLRKLPRGDACSAAHQCPHVVAAKPKPDEAQLPEPVGAAGELDVAQRAWPANAGRGVEGEEVAGADGQEEGAGQGLRFHGCTLQPRISAHVPRVRCPGPRCRAHRQSVAVLLAAGRPLRVKACGSGSRGRAAPVRPVKALRQPLEVRPHRHPQARNLLARVHPAVGAPRGGEAGGDAACAKLLFHRLLDGGPLGLTLPAAEIRPAVPQPERGAK